MSTASLVPGVPPVLVEPFVANPQDAPCRADAARLLAPTTVADAVTVDAADATTDQRPATLTSAPLAAGDGATATTSVTNPRIALPGLAIAATVLRASAAQTCSANATAASSAGEVVGLTVNGQTMTVPDQTNVTIPLGPLGTLVLNQVDTSVPGRITRRALFLQTPAATVVIAEATADAVGNPCAAAAAPTPGPGAGQPPAVPSGRARLTVRPELAARRIARGRCVSTSFVARVRGRSIARVVFRLDGRRIATDRRAPYQTRVRARPGRHRLTARVTFVAGSGTRARTLRLRFARCAPPRPAFTG